MSDDAELLRRYADGSEAAFTELVQRRVNLVYTAALRRVGHDPQLAEEVTQTVFMQCARKAWALQFHPALSGWLHRSTRFAAIDALRVRRRRIVTTEIDSMNSEPIDPAEHELAWKEIRPVIDALLDRLGERDRDAVALRFLEGCSFAQIGVKLRVSEDAARMRVDRALEKLRRALAQRGLHSTGAALGAALTQHATLAAPAGLAGAVSAGALAATTAGSGGTLVAGAFYLMSKINVGMLGALLAAGATLVVVESRANRDLQREAASLQIETAKLERRDANPAQSDAPVAATATRPPTDELARLRARIGELKARPDGVVDAEIKPRSAWRNAGHATPQAAIETFIWAATKKDFDALARSFVLGDHSKEEADAFFATLSPELQAKYGSPERLFAPFFAAGPKKVQTIDAMQVIDMREGDRPDEVVVRYWVHFADGTGHVDTLPFRQLADGWRMGSRGMGINIPMAIELIHANVDPAIGTGGPAAK